MFGAYLELNTVNGKLYAGKGHWVVRHRDRKYRYNSPVCRGYNSRIYKAYRKYGPDSFVPHTMCLFDTEAAAFEQEKTWIRELDLMNPDKGYNLTEGGEGASGHRLSDIHKLKISLANTGRRASLESRIKNSERQKGRVMPEEQRRRISATMKAKGLRPSAKAHDRARELFSGKPLSAEHRAKLSASHKGPRPWRRKVVTTPMEATS